MLKHKAEKRFIEKSRTYENIYSKCENIMLNAFKWEGLPNGIEERHIESALFDYGLAMLFKVKGSEIFNDSNIEIDDSFLILPASAGYDFNVLGDATTYIGNGYSQTFVRNINECVICRNTPNNKPSIDYVREFAQEMTEVKQAIRTNIIQQKFPFIIPTTSENEFTMKNLFNKIEEGQYAFFTDKNIDLTGLKVLDTKVPYVAGQLNEYRFELEREFLTFAGLNNHFEKSERLLVDEVNSNNTYVESYTDLMYQQRLQFCKMAKEMYGMDIKVYKRYEIMNVSRETSEEGVKEDDIN